MPRYGFMLKLWRIMQGIMFYAQLCSITLLLCPGKVHAKYIPWPRDTRNFHLQLRQPLLYSSSNLYNYLLWQLSPPNTMPPSSSGYLLAPQKSPLSPMPSKATMSPLGHSSSCALVATPTTSPLEHKSDAYLDSVVDLRSSSFSQVVSQESAIS